MPENKSNFDFFPSAPTYDDNQTFEEITAILNRQLPETNGELTQDITIRLPNEMLEFLVKRAIDKKHNTLGATIHLMLLEWQCQNLEKEES